MAGGGGSGPKSKTTAVLLACFLSFWTWLYTYKKNTWKFWVGLVLGIAGLALYGIPAIAVWIWAIIDVSIKPRSYYEEYDAKRHSAAVAEPSSVTQKPVEELVREFGWSHSVAEGWACENISSASDLTTPDLCYDVMSQVAATPGASDVFNPGLIALPGFGGGSPLIVSTSKPKPLSLVTGMRSKEDGGAFIAMLLKHGYKTTFVEGTGFVLFANDEAAK